MNFFKTFNKDKNRYVFLYIIVLVASLVWGLNNTSNVYIMLLGFLVTGFCFLLLIRIKYPRSLSNHESCPFSILSFLNKKKHKIKASLTGIFGGLCFAFGLPILAEGPLYVLLIIPAFLFALGWIVFVSTLIILFAKAPFFFQQLKVSIKKRDTKKTDKKLILFFKYRPDAWKNPIVLILAFFTYLCNSPSLCLVIAGFSWRYHNGVEFYFLALTTIVITLIVTFPCFRTYMFKNYGLSSLRLLGWNSLELNFPRLLAQGALSAGLVLGVGTATEAVNRRNTLARYKAELEIKDILNAMSLKMRILDPQGAAEGRYPLVGPSDPLPPLHNQRDIGKKGQNISKLPWDKK